MRKFNFVFSGFFLLCSLFVFGAGKSDIVESEQLKNRVRRLVFLIKKSSPENRPLFYKRLSQMVAGEKWVSVAETISRNGAVAEIISSLSDNNNEVVMRAVWLLSAIGQVVPGVSSALIVSETIPTFISFLKQRRHVNYSLAIISQMLKNNRAEALEHLFINGFLPCLRAAKNSPSEKTRELATVIDKTVYQWNDQLEVYVKLLKCPDVLDINEGLAGLVKFSEESPREVLAQGCQKLLDALLDKEGVDDIIEIVCFNLCKSLHSNK